MNRLQIPDDVVPAFNKLSQLSTEEAQKIAFLLEQYPIGGDFADFQRIFKESGLSEQIPNIDETIYSFGTLLSDKRGEDIEVLARSLSDAFVKSKKGKIAKDVAEQLKKNLLIIFENADHLKKTFKTYYLFSENKQIYLESSLMTDMRLLFNDELEKPPECGVILHQLKIEYRDENTSKTFFVSMDKEDVIELSETLQRALRKEETIKKSQSNIRFITLK